MPSTNMAKSWWNGPVRAEPDFNNILRVLQKKQPTRPTLFEFFMNETLYAHMADPDFNAAADTKPYGNVLRRINAFRNAGYDYATIHVPHFGFVRGERQRRQTISLNEGALVTDRASFESYPWPDPDKADYSILNTLAPLVPKGMTLAVPGPCGVMENANFICGYENLCYLIADDEQLAADVFEAVGSRLVRFYRKVAAYDSVGILIGNDDWGFKSQPMLSPDQMRRFVVPWHRQIAQAAHAAGKMAVMHSCGNLRSLMADIIDEIGYDGKHSYEDAIQPVENAYDEYGSQIAILGGIDVNFIVRSSPEQVYERSKAMISRSVSKGSYALGTGNSVPEYIPPENYFAMIAAATEARN